MKIILKEDVKIYDNGEDSEVYAKAGEYESLDDIKIYGVEPDPYNGGYYPGRDNFSLEHVGMTTKGQIIITWDEEFGIISSYEFTIKE